MLASKSDIDHRISVKDRGRTTDENLAPLCRYHHRIEHQHTWTYQRSDDGSYVWVTGLGQIVTTARSPP